MKKILISLLMGGFCSLMAMDETIWEHDLHAGKSIRKSGDDEKVFDIRREILAAITESLPEGAVADTWYPISQSITLYLRAIHDAEEVTLVFAQPVCELSFTLVDGEKSRHGHFGGSYEKISQFKKKRFYNCWECEGTKLLLRILRREAGSADEIVLDESDVGVRHDRKHDIKDFTNPEAQGFTADPVGAGGINRQIFENTIKGFGKKLGL